MNDITADVIRIDPKHDNFDDVILDMQLGFNGTLVHGPLFQTDATGLFDTYLSNLRVDNEADRQICNCKTCRAFVDTYGGIVTVTDTGDLVPVMWGIQDGNVYQPAIDAIKAQVEKAKITSAFHSLEPLWGVREKGGWTHYHVDPSAAQRHNIPMTEAASKERRRIVMSTFATIKPVVLDEAIRVLKADMLEQSDRYVAPLMWLRGLHDLKQLPNATNLLWKAIVSAPEGFCHPRSAMTNTLLEDIERGLSFDVISQRWTKKMHPLQFQRPQAAPSAGTLEQAEKLVAKLGIARSLERRFATLDDIHKDWTPTPLSEKIGEQKGVFGHLQTKDEAIKPHVELPPINMSWEKFVQKILPDTKQLQFKAPWQGNFAAFVTATHADAPPIYKWDHEDDRYPVSYYVYHNGSTADSWKLSTGDWFEVSAIAPVPKVTEQIERGMMLVLVGAQETRTGQGLGLFTGDLKNDLHEIRAVIEAFSKAGILSDQSTASACGYLLTSGNPNCLLKVHDGTNSTLYQIDRWD